MEKSGKPKKHVLRPLLWWFLLVLVLFGIRTHQRLMEKTRLVFTVTMQGQPHYEASTTFDGKPALSGQKISLGNHTFTVTLAKGEPFSTNMFVWYGEHNFGAIDLKRTMGTLSVSADPPAPILVIRGPEWAVTLTNSSGLTQLVPTDAYYVEADYPHWQKSDTATVFANQTISYSFAPHFGALQLGCNQPDATYQLQAANERLISNGSLPVTVAGLPAGDYKLFAVHHRHQQTETLTVKADTTTPAQLDFNYGAVVFETTPDGATVETTGNGQNVGVTPLKLVELLPGNWSFTLQRNGYQSVQLSLDVVANETNFVSTNLVSENYLHAMTAARQFIAAADYDSALKSAGDALTSRPADADATILQNEATGLGYIKRAKALGNLGDYIEGGQELKLALQSLPDNAEAKQLVTDFRQHEPEEIERRRAERLQLPKKSFDAALSYLEGASYFESYELKTGKTAAETHAAIEMQLKSTPPVFQIVRSETTGEIFVIEATQNFSGGQRRCMIVGGQSKDDETQVYFKVVESKKVSFMDQPLGALVGAMPSKYTLIDPGQLQAGDKLKNQIADGVSNVTARIQFAIGQTPAPAVQPAPPQ
jgi:tetratricopeptide (TPR) repeat protein